MTKKIIKQISLSEHQHNRGFSSVGWRNSDEFNVDPFLNIDLFRMSAPTFRPHPHAGFSAVTYMLPESSGSFANKDSFGDKSLIGPGDIHWTQAGTGMIHEEVPSVVGKDCFGFQIFVNLSEVNKKLAPASFHGSSKDIPTYQDEKSKLRVVAGSYGSLSSPLKGLATEVTMLDVTVEPEGQTSLDLSSKLNWFLFSISGEGMVSGIHKIEKHQICLLSSDGSSLQLTARSTRLRLLVCGGPPIREPVVWGGPFCMTSNEEVLNANMRFRTGQMGALEPSF